MVKFGEKRAKTKEKKKKETTVGHYVKLMGSKCDDIVDSLRYSSGSSIYIMYFYIVILYTEKEKGLSSNRRSDTFVRASASVCQ